MTLPSNNPTFKTYQKRAMKGAICSEIPGSKISADIDGKMFESSKQY